MTHSDTQTLLVSNTTKTQKLMKWQTTIFQRNLNENGIHESNWVKQIQINNNGDVFEDFYERTEKINKSIYKNGIKLIKRDLKSKRKC